MRDLFIISILLPMLALCAVFIWHEGNKSIAIIRDERTRAQRRAAFVPRRQRK